MKEFENRVFSTKKEGRRFMDNYLKEVAIVRKAYQGSHSLEVSIFKILYKTIQYIIVLFQGNQSRAFLKKIDNLQGLVEQESDLVILNALPYIHTCRQFDKVVSSCFGVGLKEGYEDEIKEFRRLYMLLGISVTPKVSPPPSLVN